MNDYNHQTPPENNSKPDYSYGYDGSERTGGSGKIRLVAIIGVVVAILLVLGSGVYLALSGFDGSRDDYSDSSYAAEETSEKPKPDKGEKPPKGDESKPDGENKNPVPDFTPSGDADPDLSTAYTEIYEHCSPSCCTVKVSVNGRLASIGSGFVIDSDGGYIATNHHVIDGADSVSVLFYDGRELEADIVGSDSVTDLAVLQVSEKGLHAVEFGDSNSIKVGENVVAIGTPYNLTLAGTMTRGIISGISRNIEMTNDSGKVVKTMTLIQTDCSINPGNSGGPLIDMAGNVIGITSLKLVDEQFEGIGFAIPITDASAIFKAIIAGEEFDSSGIATASPQIGISIIPVADGFADLGIRPNCEYPTEGILVAEIAFDSSAYKAGLSAYNIIVEFEGTKIVANADLTNALSKYKAGDTVTMKVFQFNRTFTAGEYVDITFKLDAAS